MHTYQDLEKVQNDEQQKISFVLGCINDFKGSDEYKFMLDAKQYFEGVNPKLEKYQKIIYDMQGIGHVDAVSPNHKIFSRYVFSAITEGTQYLLSNGATFEKEDTKNKLGGDSFDVLLQKLLTDAQVYGVSWGFWYYDDNDSKEKLSIIPPLQFVPLKDENTSAVRAGIRFWQIDPMKPLRFTLYEADGYTEYIQKSGEKPEILHEKRDYKVKIRSYGIGIPDEIVESENFPDFPIIPLYYINQKSILCGNTAAVDAYDLLNSKMVNNIDTGNIPVIYADWNTGKDSWQDMYLMSRCMYNIIPNSSFSWWAAYLNPNPGKIVIAPAIWKKTAGSAKKELPENWIKIEV